MILNNKLVYESKNLIEIKDYVHVITPANESFILHFTKIPQGTMIINGIEQTQYALGFIHKNSGSVFSPESLKDCKIYEVINI